MDMSAHPDGPEIDDRLEPDRLLTLEEAARVAGRSPGSVRQRMYTGRLDVTVVNGVRLVSVGELMRIGLLDRDGTPPALPEKLGLPLLMPLDDDQMLTVRDVSELFGITVATVKNWVHKGQVRSTRVNHWPVGNGWRRLISVGELVRIGFLAPDGRSLYITPKTRSVAVSPEQLAKVGLPLSVPVDEEQLLTVHEIAGLAGALRRTVLAWIRQGVLRSTLVHGCSAHDDRTRHLVSVGELVRTGLLTLDESGAPVPCDRTAGPGKRAPYVGPHNPSPLDDLPTELDDPRIGIDDPGLAQLVLVALSRFLAADTSRAASSSYWAMRFLRMYAHTEVKRAGVVVPAPCPDVDPALPIPTGQTAQRHLGLPPAYRRQEWARLQDADPVMASFTVNYVAHFVPPPLWRVFAALVHDGPALANDRLRRIIFSESQRPIDRNAQEAGQPETVTVATIRGAVTNFRRFYIRALVPMHHEGYPSPLLKPWSQAPAHIKIHASSRQADRSAPGRPLLRLAWQQLDSAVTTRLAEALRTQDEPDPSHDIDDVDAMRIVRTLPYYRLRRASIFRPCRNRALLVVFAVLGGRKAATMDLDRRDYTHDFRCPDGQISAAIALRPGKHAPADKISWKPIPAAMAHVIDLYLLVVERLLGHPLPENGPLFIPSITNYTSYLGGQAVGEMLAGAPHASPLLPKPRNRRSAADEDAATTETPTATKGYNLQALRRAALQLVRTGARSYCQDHDIDADPECLAEILLDHKHIAADTMGYADINTVQGRIRWSQVAIAINWEMLTTDRGARRIPDIRRFTEALELEKALQSELKRAEQEIDRLFEARFSAVSSELIVELMVATHRIREIDNSLAETRTAIVALEHDRDTWMILPDDAPDQKIDLKAVRRGESGLPRHQAPERVRWFLTVPEFAEFAGSAATARRWAAGQLPYCDGDPRNPWQPGDGAVDEGLGSRKRRIDVDKINPSYFDTSAKRARRDELLATIPRGFTRQECRRSAAPDRQEADPARR